MTTLERALRTPIRQAQATKYVRPLLFRTSQFVVGTPVLAAYLGSLIVREQVGHYIGETVKWSLAMYDVHCVSGAAAVRTIEEISDAVDDYIEDRIAATDTITLKLAIEAAHAILAPVYGKQLRVTGWLPGNRVAEGHTVLELSGNACPSCTVNPTGYKVGDKHNTERCLNSEDCGWIRV